MALASNDLDFLKLTYVSPDEKNGCLEFRVFLSSRVGGADPAVGLRAQAEIALNDLNAILHYQGLVRLIPAKSERVAMGVGAAAQSDIDEQIPLCQIVIGFAGDGVGPHTRQEMLAAVNGPMP